MSQTYTPDQLRHLHDVAVALVREAGAFLRADAARRRTGGLETRDKASSVDVVTAADEAIEKMIREGILANFPDHKFIGEESYSQGADKRFLLTDEPTWILDPLDGTVNYIHLFPMTAISLGFCFSSYPTIGIVLCPFLGPHGTLYSSISHQGAFLSESPSDSPIPLPLFTPAPPLPENAPNGCLFLAEWGKDRREEGGNLDRKMRSFRRMAGEKGGKVHGIRSLGSSTMDMVYVASGQGDIMMEAGCWEWDICAGVAILLETGGFLADANPPPGGLPDGAPVPMPSLGSRRYLAIRGCSPDASGRSARAQQEELVRRVWANTERLDYTRPGLDG